MSVVASPAAALLLLAIAVKVITSEALVTSILAGLVAALPSCLVCAGSSETTILTAGLSTVKSMALEMARVSRVASLLRLRRGEGRSRGSVCSGSRSTGLGERWATSVGGLGISKWLQVIACGRLGTLLSVTTSLVRASGAK
jgi:hypothetical protein